MARVHLDFETRSMADLKKVGAYQYSKHPSTVVLCMAWCVDDSPIYLWKHGDPLPVELFSWIQYGATIAAHNAFFEQCIWKNVCTPKMGWIPVPDNNWMCTLAKASAHALPRALGQCGEALGLKITKDAEGSRVMQKLTKYRTPTKNNPSTIPGTPEEYRILYRYCMTDVAAEREIDHALRDLNPKEQKLWLLDQRINFRGVKVDRAACFAALEHIAYQKQEFDKCAAELTGGAVTAFSQRDRLLKWINDSGEHLAGMDKKSVKDKLADALMGEKVREVLEMRNEATRSSTAKYEAMLRMSDEQDWRARGNLIYHGASTGRFAGTGIQLHNLAKGKAPFDKKDSDEEQNRKVWEAVGELSALSPQDFSDKHEFPMQRLSSLIRSTIMSENGYEFHVADYNAIEARVVMWLAGEMEALAGFDSGVGIYKDMASTIYAKPAEIISDDERQLGKTIVLGGGFGMGFFKFLLTCHAWGIKLPSEMVAEVISRNYNDLHWRVTRYFEDDRNRKKLWESGLSLEEHLGQLMFANQIVTSYRAKFPKIVQFWADMENAAVNAVYNTGSVIRCGKLSWLSDGQFLWLKLPSGRNLAYYSPRLEMKEKFGNQQMTLTFMTVDSITRKFVRRASYGGLLVENATQAVARDIMGEAMVRVEEAGFPVILTVHDEVISEVPYGRSNKEFCELLSTRPEWASDLPLAVAGWSGTRYKKG